MNNEPVAWLDADGFPWSKEGIACRTTPDTYIPLYTHPADLTDEEILELADKHLIAENEYIGMGDFVAVTKGEIDFARAILKKASEK